MPGEDDGEGVEFRIIVPVLSNDALRHGHGGAPGVLFGSELISNLQQHEVCEWDSCGFGCALEFFNQQWVVIACEIETHGGDGVGVVSADICGLVDAFQRYIAKATDLVSGSFTDLPSEFTG